MSYQALARKYRPQRFSDIIGQETTVRTLQNAIESERIHHAYLFSGVRGVGKTTAARILAKALNCVSGPTVEPDNTCVICREITEGIDMDVREIDAATYTGVDNIRELREVTQFQPARDRYRIFIIDEAHMLSTGAWNALLKILEEPPPHVIFMFATTEVNKVPQTIISRVQKFQLRKITLEELIGRLGEISKAEGIEADRGAIEIIARRGEGSVRDSLSLLDQVIAFSGKSITAADVATVLGLSDTNFFARVVSKISEGDHAAILEALQEAADNGRDFKMLFRDLLNFIRNLLLIAGGAPESLLAASPEDLATIREAAERFSYSDLLRIANLLIRDDETVNKAEHQRLAVEIALLKAATFPRLKAVEAVLSGAPAASPASVTEKAAGKIASATPSSLDGLQQRIQKTKPLIASYLSHAKSAKKDGNRITWTFDDATYADYVKDSKTTIEQIASDVFGERVTIEAIAEVMPQNRRAEDKPSALRDDPVMRAFQKHLGAEIVEGRRTK
ncbi:MAG TPA: DNA polymerase III subunit gamma/tau [Thermoanaerobaculia bacterium]|jgi:DNA polymerase-3 subunit gamma/tau|nr:DNA polymerase III subunit gamma/tau [Thermoanaerobaculia bacterium]